MRYIIDGYNLLFRLSLTEVERDLEVSRERILADLGSCLNELGLNASFVFDAHKQPGLGERSHRQSLEICFTDEGETADEYILKEIARSKAPRQITVVTSDKRLAAHARGMSAATLSVEQFIQWIKKKTYPKRDKTPQKSTPPATQKTQQAYEVPDAPPSPGATLEECFDYYLYHFEKRNRQDR